MNGKKRAKGPSDSRDERKRPKQEAAVRGAEGSNQGQGLRKENLPNSLQHDEDAAFIQSINFDQVDNQLAFHQHGTTVFRPRTRDLWKRLGPQLENFNHYEDLKSRDKVRELVDVIFPKYVDEMAISELKRVERERAAAVSEGRIQKFSRRPGDRAFSKMRAEGYERFPGEKILGHVPGIRIGDTFTSRVELILAGLHRQTQSGIDSVILKGSEVQRIATSIVVSGEYKDDVDDGDYLTYTGQGGNNLLSDKRQCKDQILNSNNLALSKNAEYCVPVRVIRNYNVSNGRQLVYDGLYDVKRVRKTRGEDGFVVFKYDLVRCPGQRERCEGAGTVKWGGRTDRPKKTRDFGTVVCEDITHGAEVIPIPAVNNVDNMLPPGIDFCMMPEGSGGHWLVDKKRFHYTTRMSYGSDVKLPTTPQMLTGPGPNHKEVSRLNRLPDGILPYHNGILGGISGILYECGPYMNCPKGVNCPQAITQAEIKIPLQLFKTKDRGWAVRTMEAIPAWTFISKYIGIVISVKENNSSQDDYAIDLGRRSDYDAEGVYKENGTLLDVQYAVTGAKQGNIFRYINHSCDPNLYVQPTLNKHLNPSMPDITLFSFRPIRAYEELTYDYGRSFLEDRSMECKCGAAVCSNRVIIAE